MFSKKGRIEVADNVSSNLLVVSSGMSERGRRSDTYCILYNTKVWDFHIVLLFVKKNKLLVLALELWMKKSPSSGNLYFFR